MGVIKEIQLTPITCVSSGGSVSSGAAAIANGAANLTNSTTLAITCTAQLSVTPNSAPSEGGTVALYLVPKTDGTNVSSVDASTPFISPNYFAGNFWWSAPSGTTIEYMSIDLIQLSPIDYVPYLVNNLGVQINSGWSLFIQPRADQA